MFPVDVKQDDVLPFCFNSHSVKIIIFFSSLFSATLLGILCFFLVILLFKMDSKHSAEMFCSFPKHENDGLYGENTCVR